MIFSNIIFNFATVYHQNIQGTRFMICATSFKRVGLLSPRFSYLQLKGRIQCFGSVLVEARYGSRLFGVSRSRFFMSKIEKKFSWKKSCWLKIAMFIFLGLHEELKATEKAVELPPPQENIQLFKICIKFLGHFCLPGSGTVFLARATTVLYPEPDPEPVRYRYRTKQMYAR